MKSTEYIHIPKGSMNHGFSSGEVSTGEFYFTKNYIFLIPFTNGGMTGIDAHHTDFTNAKEFAESITQNIDSMNIVDFEEKLKQFVGSKFTFKVTELEKMSVQIGWWFFGGMRIKTKENGLMSMNVQPKAVREQVKQFYNL
ncbi:MAG: hypothetical protein IPL10_07530 [Bacteroidetes bacterium]|nr:hypothetical protein [Bacteroidota bacterium]